ncbi:MAG: hypothetical protein HKN31_07325 [Pricia sp.]|nr:hypothetical protein [Pricia sp.]
MILHLLVSSACNRDDQSFQEDNNLAFKDTNLQGDWKRTAQYISQANDSLGILMPTEDLFVQFDYCRKDDIIRYQKGDEQTENIYFWGIGEMACHSQISNSFREIGTWNIEKSGKLTHSYSDVDKSLIVVILRTRKLLIRNESGTKAPDGTVYEFTEYERVR